jgi:hypothetical protein
VARSLTTEDIIDAQSRYVILLLLIEYIPADRPHSAFLKGGEVLSRPGVVQAGQQAAFTDEKETIPSAFDRQPAESDEQRHARFR